MIGRNGVRVALATLTGSCAVAGGVVLMLPHVISPDDAVPRDGAALAARPDAAAAADAPAPTIPSFDMVRLDPDGAGLVAGRAEPGASVRVMADGEVAAEAVADVDGRFVAFLDVPPAAGPVELSLRDREGAHSEATVVLAPLAEPPPAAVPEPLDPEQADTVPDPSETAEPDGEGVVALPSPAAAASVTERDMAAAQPKPPSGPRPIDDGTEPVVAGTPPDAPAAGPQVSVQSPVLLSEPEGVRVLQPALAPGAGPEVLSSVALDAIAYGGAGEVTLTGRGTGGDAVRLYLDNRSVAEAPIDPEGYWRAELGATEPGTYALRIDQVNAVGDVVSRTETPFQREERAAVAAAMSEAEVSGQTIAIRTVQPGNTLWAIARDRYGEPMMFVRVFEANRDRIRDPDLIYPGQVFVLPASAER